MNRPVVAEGLGTGLFLFVIVGSGITVERLGGDAAAGLFIHAAVVGAALAALVATFISVSGAHFNPAVTLALWRARLIERASVAPYLLAQVTGAVVGVVAAHLAFDRRLMAVATIDRSGWGRPAAELVATFGLVAIILMLVRSDRLSTIPAAVGAWVTAIIVGTSSTGFANPAVTIARSLTDSYTGIAPIWVPGFVVAQVLGAALSVLAIDRFVLDQRSVHDRR